MMVQIRLKLKNKSIQLLDDINPTLNDAKKMYAFLDEFIVKNMSDVTIMCDLRDLHLIVNSCSKPQSYENLFELIDEYEKMTKNKEKPKL